MPGEEEYAIMTAWYITDICSAVLHVTGFILTLVVLLLVGVERLTNTNTTRLILAYLLVFVLTSIPALPMDLLQRFNPTWSLGQHGCQFLQFLRGLLWPAKGILVLSIATFSFIEGRATNGRRDNHATVKLLVTLAVVGVLSLSFAIVRAVYSVERVANDKVHHCYSEHDLFYIVFTRLVMNGLCIILSALVSVILVIVGRCIRGGNGPDQVAANVVVITYFLLWLPRSLTMLGHFGIWASFVASALAYTEVVMTPILLLVVSTPYNQALRKRVCKRHQDDPIHGGAIDNPETMEAKVELELLDDPRSHELKDMEK